MIVSPLSAVARFAASHNSSGTRTERVGVAGLFGTRERLGRGVYTPQRI